MLWVVAAAKLSVFRLARLQLVVVWQRLHGFAPDRAILPEYILAGPDLGVLVERAGRDDHGAAALGGPG